MTVGFLLLAFFIVSSRLQAASETNGQPAITETILTNRTVLSEGVGRDAAFVLEQSTTPKSRAKTTVGIESI